MKIFRGVPRLADRQPCALTIGNFDGVHRGHQALLSNVVRAATQRELIPAVMTFEPHPREFFAPLNAPARVANLRDTLESIGHCGIERVFVMHFNQRFASLSAERFIDEILLDGCRARWLMVGDDFRFGAKRAGDVALLRQRAASHDCEVEQLATVKEDGDRISSSAVRAALALGDLQRAANLLGHPYFISGRVVHGAKLGKTIGFPTLNLRFEPLSSKVGEPHPQRQPALQGIYAVRVHGVADRPWPGVASMGLRPTVDQSGRWLLEVHLFDFNANVYGRLVRVEFVQKLRDEQKFNGLDQLAAAIRNDAAQARALLGVRTA